MNASYDELAARAQRGELGMKPDTVRRGEEASGEAQKALQEATGATDLEVVRRIALNAPTPDVGPS